MTHVSLSYVTKVTYLLGLQKLAAECFVNHTRQVKEANWSRT